MTDNKLNADFKLNQIMAFVAFWSVLEMRLNRSLYSRRAVGKMKTGGCVYDFFPALVSLSE